MIYLIKTGCYPESEITSLKLRITVFLEKTEKKFSKTWPLLEDLKRVLEVRPKPTRDNRSKHGKRGLLSIGTFGRVE